MLEGNGAKEWLTQMEAETMVFEETRKGQYEYTVGPEGTILQESAPPGITIPTLDFFGGASNLTLSALVASIALITANY